MALLSKFESTYPRTRIIILMDVDAFEVQVYQKYLFPETKGKICVVANGKNRITAVSYEAKAVGLSRAANSHVRDDLRKRFPEMIVLSIPERPGNGKPDFALARKATNEIVSAILTISKEIEEEVRPVFEYSSKDEFYLDITDMIEHIISTGQTYSWMKKVGFESLLWPKTIVESEDGSIDAKKWNPETEPENMAYALGLIFASDLVRKIKEMTEFQVSVGLGPNKLLAKMACGQNKPAAITLVTWPGFRKFSENVKIEDVPQFGGKRGAALVKFLKVKKDGEWKNPEVLADLRRCTRSQIAGVPKSPNGKGTELFGDQLANEFYDWIRGKCEVPVVYKLGPESISCTNNYMGPSQNFSFEKLKREMIYLVQELLERAVEERMIRHREPMAMKFEMKVVGANKKSARLDYSSDQTAESIADTLLSGLAISSDVKFDRKVEHLEVLGKPFRALDNTEVEDLVILHELELLNDPVLQKELLVQTNVWDDESESEFEDDSVENLSEFDKEYDDEEINFHMLQEEDGDTTDDLFLNELNDSNSTEDLLSDDDEFSNMSLLKDRVHLKIDFRGLKSDLYNLIPEGTSLVLFLLILIYLFFNYNFGSIIKILLRFLASFVCNCPEVVPNCPG